jgi:hypothetical protein
VTLLAGKVLQRQRLAGDSAQVMTPLLAFHSEEENLKKFSAFPVVPEDCHTLIIAFCKFDCRKKRNAWQDG